jgi:Recombination endonuclease VII
MISRNERRRKRYAEDPEYREKVNASRRAYNRNHRERINARERQRRRSDPEFRARERARSSEKWRTTTYGLTAEDYLRMLTVQNGACAICKQKSHEKLCVDHCHVTGKVRGLLCRKCNSGLGFYDDDSNRLREAGTYVDAAHGLPDS